MLINVDKYVKLGKIASDFRRYQEVSTFCSVSGTAADWSSPSTSTRSKLCRRTYAELSQSAVAEALTRCTANHVCLRLSSGCSSKALIYQSCWSHARGRRRSTRVSTDPDGWEGRCSPQPQAYVLSNLCLAEICPLTPVLTPV
jgi:hypothetical protein